MPKGFGGEAEPGEDNEEDKANIHAGQNGIGGGFRIIPHQHERVHGPCDRGNNRQESPKADPVKIDELIFLREGGHWDTKERNHNSGDAEHDNCR